jgi:hypothetical protein
VFGPPAKERGIASGGGADGRFFIIFRGARIL